MKTTLILVAITAAIISPVHAASTPPQPRGTITVTGNAEVRVAPDTIHIHAGVETRDANLDAAVSENDRRIAGAIRFLGDLQIGRHDLQTDRINLIPVYPSREDRDLTKPSYYDVERHLAVCLHSSTNFDQIITGLVKSGVTHIHDIEFRDNDLRQHRDQARILAMRAAREKAEALSREAGVKLGLPISISENTYGGSYLYSGARGNQWASQNSVAYGGGNTGGSDSGDSTLALGNINISATVNVTFELK